MNKAAPAPVSFSANEGFIFLSLYIVAIAVCLAVPRALSFLPAVISLGGVAYLRARHGAFPACNKKIFGFLAGFSLLLIASSLWSPDADYALEKSFKIAAVILSTAFPLMAAQAFTPDTNRKNAFAVFCALLCACAGAILAIEYNFRFPVTRFLNGIEDGDSWPVSIVNGFLLNRTCVFLVLLCLPVILMVRTSALSLRKKYILLGLLVAGVGAMLLSTNSQTAQIAAVIAVIMLFYPSHKKAARRFFTGAVLVVMFVMPLTIALAQKLMPQDVAVDSLLFQASAPHRLEVWGFIVDEIKKSPIIGQGVEATRFLKAGHIMPYMQSDHVIHPHNAVLQIWIELGLIGILPAMVFIFYALSRLDDKSALLQRYYISLFTALGVVLCISYGLWQAWLTGMIQTVFALSIIATKLHRLDGEEEI